LPCPAAVVITFTAICAPHSFAAFLRFNRLSVPDAVIFDETYYVKDAWPILQRQPDLS
jgi:dolichyl-phosphate-mannose--protein O-mannosyl transferase